MNYLTLKEIHDKFGIPVPTLRNWVKTGKLPYKQLSKSTKIYIEELDIPTYLRMAGKKGNNEI